MTIVYWWGLEADWCLWVVTLGPFSPPEEQRFYDPVMGNAVESGYFCDPIVRSNQSINPYFSVENTKQDCEEKPIDYRKPW